ncbi:APC family permease [Actinoplanes teichomyceticus]|uniref:APC family permease n=1 Tax=Actinoplanes teichomyceticus TaxID=1867 RepID=UPI0021CC8ACB|nr:APC family permease [Actinoplanes teichomyceticus]
MASPDEPVHPAPAGLAGARVGAGFAAFFGASATAPIATMVTVTPPVLATGAGPLAALSILAVTVLLLLFSTPYAAMIRRHPGAGAAYPQIARGLGRPAALIAAWLALAGYHAIQFGLYAMLGQAAAPLLDNWFAVSAPWWAVAAGCWALVACCGTLRVEFAAGVIALLSVAQAAVLTGLAAANVLRPAGDRIEIGSVLPTDPARVDRPLLGLLLVVAVLAFVGIETAGAYAEESHDPRRTTGRAARVATLLVALLLAGVTWSVVVAAGPREVAGRAAARGPELLFALADERLAPWAVTLSRLTLLTGLLAAILALHHAITRQLYALGRERVLPGVLGQVSHHTGAPRAASLTQSLIVGAALTGAHLAGAEASARTARRLVVGGGLAVLVLLLLTALGALLHLNRAPGRENLWTRFLTPVVSTVFLGLLLHIAGRHLPSLLGVRSGSIWVTVVLGGLAACLVTGLAHALVLRTMHPVRYAGIGLGGVALVVTPQPDPDESAAVTPDSPADPWSWSTSTGSRTAGPASPRPSAPDPVPGPPPDPVPGPPPDPVPGRPPGSAADAPASEATRPAGDPSGTPAKLPRQRTPGAHRPERVRREVNG